MDNEAKVDQSAVSGNSAAYEARVEKARARIAELDLQENAKYAFLVRRASRNINDNDYGEGFIVGRVTGFSGYGGGERCVEVSFDWAEWVSELPAQERKINILLRDIVAALRDKIDYTF